MTCREVMHAYLQRIDRYNSVYNAIVSRVEDDQLLRQAEIADRELGEDRYLKPEVVWEIEGSLDLSSQRVYAAGIARSDWFRALARLFERYDFLALPTAQVFPFSKDVHWPSKINDRQMDTYHRWMEVVIGGTLAGLPVVNVPVGFDARGRPAGMQPMGPFGEDQRALQLALAYEGITDFLGRRPVLREPGPSIS